MSKLQLFDTPMAAMKATLRAGDHPVLSGHNMRSEKLDPAAVALELGCTARYDERCDRYYFTPAN
jgi:hypothetical protein